MFTGLVEDLGEVVDVRRTADGGVLKIKTSLDGIEVGDSISVNGACLTVIELEKDRLTFEVSKETFSRTNLGFLRKGDRVNLERALRLDSRLGGHIILGHVDFTSRVKSFRRIGDHRELVITIPPDQEKFFVEKGSVAVDGISLTVNRVGEGSVVINVIPHTFENTNLKYRKVGDLVNVETDIIGKYVVRCLSGREKDLEMKLRDIF